jgi:hypothetical protein
MARSTDPYGVLGFVRKHCAMAEFVEREKRAALPHLPTEESSRIFAEPWKSARHAEAAGPGRLTEVDRRLLAMLVRHRCVMDRLSRESHR